MRRHHSHSPLPAKLASLLLIIGSSILLSADTCEAFPPSLFRSRSTSSLSRASIPLSTFEAIDIFTSVATESKLRRDKIYRCPTRIYSSSAAVDGSDGEGDEKKKYIRPYLKQLLLLCRPINFPIVFLFHVLGVHRAVEFWKMTMQPVSTSSSSMLLSLLKEPSMIMVLLSLMLVTSTSMITNDYYDARNGVDVVPDDTGENGNIREEYGHYHPLAQGTVPFSVTKTFDSVSMNNFASVSSLEEFQGC
mmetsp:Transcript_30046/g.46547  ORF Transcript_30046/g.46547 Transcript_30046/m.46547 type:complete len:248 (+) Transcript_30046:36-779(+)